MAQVEPPTKITEPIPRIVRPGRPTKSHGFSPSASRVDGNKFALVPPMPEELPKGKWTEQAVKVLNERYLLKDDEGKVLETPDGMCWRVAWDIASANASFGKSYKEILDIAKDYYHMLSSHDFLPNSPTLMNAGKNNGLQYNGCFVIPVDDSIEGIFDGVKWTAIIHKSGGGTGFAFSRLRPSGSRVGSTKGVASGPVSFMRIYDAATEQIKQGGSRRGANMGVLRVDHPDILEFIHCKESGGVTNFNISVTVTDEFMRAYYEDREYDLVDPTNRKVVGKISARKVMQEIVEAAWKTGDPGMIFIDRINDSKANPVPSLGPIETPNPCVTGETLVSTTSGLRHIKDLFDRQEDANVIIDSRLGRNREGRVGGVVRTGYKPVFVLRTAEGYKLRLTGDHRLMAKSGWRKASDLKPGETIFLINRPGGFGEEGSRDLGQVLGWLVGDGTMKAAEVVLSFFGQEKKQLAPRFASMVSVLTDGMQRPRSYPVGVGWIDERDEARVGSTRLWEIARSFGLGPGHKLLVPEKVLLGRKEMQQGFLQALFTADGHVEGNPNKGTSVRLTSVSLELLTDVQRLLLNFGIISRIYTFRRQESFRSMPDGRGGKKDYFCQAYHDLVISKNNLWKFAEEIGFLVDYKNAKLVDTLKTYKRGPYADRYEATFVELTADGEDWVYDLTEATTHSFVANGLVVHNCGEQPLYPFDACNLGSIFLTYFVKEKDGRAEVDWERLGKITRLAVRFLDDVIERNPIPLPQIKETVSLIRRIGLGIGGWADMLVELGISYDSQEALELAERVMKFVNEKGHEASEELARERGAFPLWSESIYCNDKPLRNSTVTTIAPTGTIGHLAGTSQGIEPFFAIAFKHYVKTNALERSLYYFNTLFEKFAEGKSWYTSEVKDEITEAGTIAHIEEIPAEVRRLFVTAHEIDPEWHVRVQAAFQKYTDNAVSKTINLPNSSTPEDIKRAYLMAYETGCRGITVYRDGSKAIQVLNLGTKNKGAKVEQRPVLVNGHNGHATSDKESGTLLRPRPTVGLPGVTYRTETPLGNAFITINSTADGEPFEVFISVGRGGSDVAADVEAIGRLISMSLRIASGVSPRSVAFEVVDQLKGIGGPNPIGFGPNRVKSLADAVAKVLEDHLRNNLSKESTELGGAKDEAGGSPSVEAVKPYNPYNGDSVPAVQRDICPSCGAAAFVFEEGCAKCYACGYSKC